MRLEEERKMMRKEIKKKANRKKSDFFVEINAQPQNVEKVANLGVPPKANRKLKPRPEWNNEIYDPLD